MSKTKADNKLRLVETGKELPLAIHPESFHVSKNFHFHVDSPLGLSQPQISFQSGGQKNLNLHLKYDQDVDDSVKITEVLQFMQEAEKIQSETDSPSAIEFRMGQFVFTGMMERYSFRPTRFDRAHEMTAVDIQISLIEVENEEA